MRKITQQALAIPAADLQDVDELAFRIAGFRKGQENEERFRHFRLTRGVYGQRQPGVQMFRIKIPSGHFRAAQLRCVADVADQYTNGNLHLTTRQNIQLHYIRLEDSPAIWKDLAQLQITAREACGNTVRNITASPYAGIDPQEPFDVTPYVQEVFTYFLRNPICQDMGRKIKIAFSASEQDAAGAFFHDFGFIPRIQQVSGAERRGFRVLVGGGLGAVAIPAEEAYSFLPEEEVIPFLAAALRVFDRHGEREKRMKARLKFLLQKIGLAGFLDLVKAEYPGLPHTRWAIAADSLPGIGVPPNQQGPREMPLDATLYAQWLATNVITQKQSGYYAIQVRVPLGNLTAQQARVLADLVEQFAADDIRFTLNQGLILKFLTWESLPFWFNNLHALGLAQPGFDSVGDITACPGTDTCALAVTNSTALALELERVIREDFPALLAEQQLKIKISGCMNSCGQHMVAQIGLHGSSLRRENRIIPAMQVVLGGGIGAEGQARLADKIIKLPTRRIPAAVRLLLTDYLENAEEGSPFNDYVLAQGSRYFYHLLKPLADLEELPAEAYVDWGQQQQYQQAIGIGECAGVQLDVVGTILGDAGLQLQRAKQLLGTGAISDSIYCSYLSQVIAAKALLLARDIQCNTHAGILRDFQVVYTEMNQERGQDDFAERVLRMQTTAPEAPFGVEYLNQAAGFFEQCLQLREAQLAQHAGIEKPVISAYYKA